MAETAFVLDVVFESTTCPQCGIPFAAPRFLFTKRRETHAEFFCPNGHSQHFPAQTEAERLRDELKNLRDLQGRTMSRLNLAERSAKKHERAAKRMASRVSRGVCPCCNRTFGNLARHMATKHPEQVPQVAPRLP